MIPINDKIFIFTNRKPVFTYCLIGLNIFLFFWELLLELNGQLGDLINNWGIIPGQITGSIVSLFSGNQAVGVLVIWRLISLFLAMFLHGSFAQILGNMLYLWVFGKTIEKVLGSGRYILFYILNGVLVGVVQVFAEPNLNIPLVGANGAIAAILGAYIWKFPKVKVYSVIPLLIMFIPLQIPAIFYIVLWFLQQGFYSIGGLNVPGGINQFSLGYWAHGAGLIMGAMAMRILQKR